MSLLLSDWSGPSVAMLTTGVAGVDLFILLFQLLLSFCTVLTQERIMFHYSVLVDSNVSIFYGFKGSHVINVASRMRKERG